MPVTDIFYMINDVYLTVSQAAHAIGVDDNTLRLWSTKPERSDLLQPSLITDTGRRWYKLSDVLVYAILNGFKPDPDAPQLPVAAKPA